MRRSRSSSCNMRLGVSVHSHERTPGFRLFVATLLSQHIPSRHTLASLHPALTFHQWSAVICSRGQAAVGF